MTEIMQEVFPGTMVFWLFFIAQNTTSDIYVEQDKHTLMRLLASPVTVNQFIISKLLRCFLLCYIIEAIMVIITYFLFGMSWGNLFLLDIITFAINLSITGSLAVIYGISATKQRADMISTFFILFMALLGGSMIPADQLPGFIKQFSPYTINYHAIEGLKAVVRGEEWANFIQPTIILTAFGIISLIVGTMLIQRRLEEKPA